MLLREHGEALEADLAFRGIDLLDFYRGRLTARRLWVLVRYLPAESAFVTAVRGSTWQPGDAETSSGIRVARSMKEVASMVRPDWRPPED